MCGRRENKVKEKKALYEKALLDIVLFGDCDVILTSFPGEGGGSSSGSNTDDGLWTPDRQ